jgi:hypothetical protein
MNRKYRIRDTQRFIALPLLLPLVPLLLQAIHPAWTNALFFLEAFVIVLAFWMLFRPRQLIVCDDKILIDSGIWKQELSHEQIYEFIFIKNNIVRIRLEGHTRSLRILAPDHALAIAALHAFAWRHAIPLTHKPADRTRAYES